MKLWVMRHGEAGSDAKDPKKERERPLTAEGKATVAEIAHAMVELGEEPKCIFASPYVRTQQTADIVGKILGLRVDLLDELSPHMPLAEAVENLIGHGDLKRVMIVGHHDNIDPFFDDLATKDKWKHIIKAEVRRVEIDRDTGEWELKWSLLPSDVGRPDRD